MKKIIALQLLIFLSFGMQAQITITGKVVTKESKVACAGVDIVEKGTSNTTVTDLDGKFSIVVADSTSILVFSYIGYKPAEVAAKQIGTSGLLEMEDEYIEIVEEYDAVSYMIMSKDESRKAKRGEKISAHYLSKPMPMYEMKIADGAAASEAYSTSSNSDIRSGMLTAGEVNDFSKWNLWTDISATDLATYHTIWQMQPQDRYTIQLKNQKQLPLIDAQINILDKQKKSVWTARTDNTGKAELWPTALTKEEKSEYTVEITYKGKSIKMGTAKEFHTGINVQEINVPYEVPNAVDIAFVVDATSSMGDEINHLKVELIDIMKRVKDTLSERTVNLGTIFYKDYTDDYVTKVSDFSEDAKQTIDFMNNNPATGGGDFPEAVDDALEVAMNTLSWNENALSRILFLILDAPPHQEQNNIDKLHDAIRLAAEKGIRIVPVTCSGIDKSTEYLMRSMALLTNGTYSFLTDDSGIGNPHIKPTTDEYDVEYLNDLIVRVIYQYTKVPSLEDLKDPAIADTMFVSNAPTLKNGAADDSLAVIDSIQDDPATDNPDSDNPKNHDPLNKIVEWQYYPNPTTGILYVTASEGIEVLYVNDISGKILERYVLNGDTEFVVDISEYPVGIYFIGFEHKPDEWLKGKIMKVER